MREKSVWVDTASLGHDMWLARCMEMEWRFDIADDRDKPERKRAFESAVMAACRFGIWSPAMPGYRKAVELARKKDEESE